MTPEEAAKTMEIFRKKRIAHRVASDARDALLQKLISGGGERLIALVGPSAVGKSTVLARVQEKLIEHHNAEIEADPGFLPYIAISAVTGLDGNFSWRDGFARLLSAGAEPLIGKKIKDKNLFFQLDGINIATTRGLVRDEFRRAFESMVKNRRIQYVFIDEASAIVDASVNRNLVRQFNIVKSLCISLNIAIVISGAYDLLGFSEGNGQLVRRTETIHMRRYVLNESPLANGEAATAYDHDENGHFLLGIDHFSRALNALINNLPVEIDNSVFDDLYYFFTKSVGCVGNLHRWLDRGCTRALIHNSGILTKNTMELTALPNKTVLKLLTESRIGEEQLKDIPDAEIAAMYGAESLELPQQELAIKSQTAVKQRRSIGERGPSRDKVGELRE